MQVSVEAKEGLERELTVQVPAERVNEAVDNRLKSLVKSVRLRGFRPGKVPLKVVQQRFGTKVRQEVVSEVIQLSFQEAVAKEKLVPVGSPSFETRSTRAGDNLEYVAKFEVYPDVKLSPMEDLKIEKPVADVTEADVDNMLEALRHQRIKWEEVNRAAAKGDRIIIDFIGTINGKELSGGKGDKAPIVIGSGALLEDFERQLEGLQAGNEKILNVTFPDDHRAKELSGNTAQFTVKVHSVQMGRLPEVDEAFAASLGLRDGGVAALRADVRQNMERELAQAIRRRLKKQVMDELLAANTVALPSVLVKEETARLLAEAMDLPKGANTADLSAEEFEPVAKRRVQLGLIIAEIVRANDLKAAPQKVKATIEGIAATYENPQQVVKYYHENKKLLNSIEASVLEDEIVDLVLGVAQVTEKPLNFKKLTNSSSGGSPVEGSI